MGARFRTPETIITGCGSTTELPEQAKKQGTSALLVTGAASLKDLGRLRKIVAGLDAAGIDVTVFSHKSGEPSTDDVDDARQTLSVSRCNMVIAVGGGSVIDLGKAVAALAKCPHAASVHLAGKPFGKCNVPFLACPTTSGTGSEMTPNSVLIDREKKIKKSLRAESMMPNVAIVDPELTVTKPPAVTASSGMDALTQAIESYLSRNATPLTESLSLGAVALIVGSLEKAYRRGDDIDARTAMAYGSMQAGIALANARLGVVHGVVHPLGALYGVGHGIACAVLLPHVLEFNQPAVGEKMKILNHYLAGDCAAFIRALMGKLEIPGNLREYHLKPEDFPLIAEQAMSSGSTMANPRDVSPQDVIALLEKVA